VFWPAHRRERECGKPEERIVMAAAGVRSQPVQGGPRAGGRLDAKALAAFFALAYALSCSWAIPLVAAHQVVLRGEGWPTHYPALLGPAIAAVVVTAWTMGRPGVRDLLARMARWRVPIRWWLMAVSPAAFLGLALIMMAATGKTLPSVADFGRFSGLPATGVAGVLLLIFIGALAEETGWRGYALPQLQRRFSPLASSLILALLWFGWHLPQFLLIASYRNLGAGGYAGMFFGLACGAVILTWLYNRSGGSILLVALWHGLYNLVAGTQAAAGMLAAVVSALIMIQAIILVVVDLRARHRGQPSVLGSAEPANHRRA
jgi:uncharacterized protein